MIIGALTIRINLSSVSTLKEKRSIVKSLIGRIKSRYNFSVAEVESHDSKLQACIGLSTVSNDTVHVNRQMDKLIDFVRADGRFYIGQIERETFSSFNH